jgi:hypothetical protein
MKPVNEKIVQFCWLRLEKGNNVDWPYVDTQKGNNVDTLLGTKTPTGQGPTKKKIWTMGKVPNFLCRHYSLPLLSYGLSALFPLPLWLINYNVVIVQGEP